MDAEFQFPRGIKFELEHMLPKAYRGIVLRGAQVLTVSSDIGTVIIQTFEQPLFTIRYKFHEFVRPVKIPFKQKAATLVSFLALKNNIHYSFKNAGLMVKLKQREFTLMHFEDENLTAHFEKGKKYQSFEVSWSEKIVQETAAYFDLLKQVSNGKKSKSFGLMDEPHNAGVDALKTVQQILNSRFEDSHAALFFQYKIREYLLFLLVDSSKSPGKSIQLSDDEWKRIDAIALRLRTEPAKKFPIAQLAITAQMNTMKLKVAFKERYGQGIFEYQLSERFNEALRLLKETELTVKEISVMVGYKISTSFMTKFREHFGLYVTDIRKNKKK